MSSWSKVCRYLNLAWCIFFIALLCSISFCRIFSIEWIGIDVDFWWSFSGIWLGMATWEKGTIKRIRGEIKDDTLCGNEDN